MNKTTIIKKISPYILGIIIGYELTLHLFSEMIPVLIGTQGPVYPLVLYSTLAVSILFFVMVFQLILVKQVSRPLIYCFLAIYFVVLAALLFCRYSYESFVVINPIVGLLDAISSREMLLQSILNILIFVPIGYFFKERNIGVTIISSLIISLIIETIQYIFRLGFFDTFDCLLYIGGICLGRAIVKMVLKRMN